MRKSPYACRLEPDTCKCLMSPCVLKLFFKWVKLAHVTQFRRYKMAHSERREAPGHRPLRPCLGQQPCQGLFLCLLNRRCIVCYTRRRFEQDGGTLHVPQFPT